MDDNRARDWSRSWGRYAAMGGDEPLGCLPSSGTVILVALLAILYVLLFLLTGSTV